MLSKQLVDKQSKLIILEKEKNKIWVKLKYFVRKQFQLLKNLSKSIVFIFLLSISQTSPNVGRENIFQENFTD